jgi:dolichol-phosphate mannosyltransferase
VQQPRLHGASNWTIGRKLNLVLDTITSFSHFPVRCITCTGLIVFSLGIIAGACALGIAFARGSLLPWAALLALVLLLAGMQMVMLGVLGEYVWRTLADARRRPQFLIEATVGLPDRLGIARRPDSGALEAR